MKQAPSEKRKEKKRMGAIVKENQKARTKKKLSDFEASQSSDKNHWQNYTHEKKKKSKMKTVI